MEIASIHELSSVGPACAILHMLTERVGKQPRQDGAGFDCNSRIGHRNRPSTAGWRRNLSRSRRAFRPRRRTRPAGRWRGRVSRRRRQSVQSNPDGTPTGTGNVTAMFSRGYIEVLFKTADTPLGREFDLALAGHAGVHLAAFSVADARGAAPALDRGGLCHAAAGAVPAPGRDRDRAGHRGLHGGAARTRRDGGGPHPDAGPSYRGHGVAAALAVAS